MEVSYACLQATKNPRWAYNYWHSYILDGFSVLQMTIYATLVSCRSDDLVVLYSGVLNPLFKCCTPERLYYS